MDAWTSSWRILNWPRIGVLNKGCHWYKVPVRFHVASVARLSYTLNDDWLHADDLGGFAECAVKPSGRRCGGRRRTNKG